MSSVLTSRLRRGWPGALVLALILSLRLALPAVASQGSGCMPTTGTVSGLTFAQDVNAGIAALISSNSGGSAPATDCTAVAVTGQVWLDTSVTPNAFRQYDGSSWVTIGRLDASNHLFAPPIGGGISTAASASTVDLGVLPSAAVSITGTTTITSFGSSAVVGTIRPITFAGSLTLTHHATSLILPGAESKVTQAGDSALAMYLGSGNWRVIDYVTASIPTKSSPTTSDFALIQDVADSNTQKKATLSSVAALITPASLSGAQGLVVTNNSATPNTSIDVTADQAVMVAAGVPIYASGVSVTINTTTTGANALDTGTRAVSTWYNLFLISNGSVTAGLASLSATAPTLPSGYTYFVRVGAMRTDGSGNFLRTRQLGNRTQYTVTLPTITTTAPGVGSYSSVSVSNFVPPTATELFFNAHQQVGSALIYINPNTTPTPSVGGFHFLVNTPATLSMAASGSLLLESSNIGWAATGTPLLSALGWIDKVNAH